jgi:protein ImuB
MERRPARSLALWCPDWPVTAAGADLDAPVAVLAGEGARRVVAACSPAAR